MLQHDRCSRCGNTTIWLLSSKSCIGWRSSSGSTTSSLCLSNIWHHRTLPAVSSVSWTSVHDGVITNPRCLVNTPLSTWPGHGTVCQALSHWCLYYSLQEALFDHQFFLHHRFVFLFSIFCFVRCRSSSLLTLYHHNRIRPLKSWCR